MAKTRDIATVAGSVYQQIVPRHFGEVHKYLLGSIESHLAKNPDGVLVVLGPGGDVLPYSRVYEEGKLGGSNRGRMLKMIGNGKVIFVDYVVDYGKSGLLKGKETLQNFGFFDEGFFKCVFDPEEPSDPSDLEARSISFLRNNLRDNLRIAGRTVDAVDATQSIHHAAVTRQELARLCSELFRILKPGGMAHIAEGDSDMGYSEDKIIRIAQDLAEIVGLDIFVSDERESGYVIKSLFRKDMKYVNLPAVPQEPAACMKVQITSDGLVIFGNTPKLTFPWKKYAQIASGLKKRGYNQMFEFEDKIVLPLIDYQMPEDIEKFLKPVDEYHEAVRSRIRKLFPDNPQLVETMDSKLDFEKGNAMRATVEYRVGKERMAKTLKSAGFVNIRIHKPEGALSYSILAYRPL